MESKNLETIVEKANAALEAVQSLQLQPTEYNATRIISVINGVREICAIASRMQMEIDKLQNGKPEEPPEAAVIELPVTQSPETPRIPDVPETPDADGCAVTAEEV